MAPDVSFLIKPGALENVAEAVRRERGLVKRLAAWIIPHWEEEAHLQAWPQRLLG